MDDDAPTPQVQPVPEYLRGDVDADDPAAYLVQKPTAEEHLLSEQVGLHNGAAVPWWMFAKLVVRDRRRGRWIAQMDGLFRKVRRYAIAGVTTLAVNLTAIGGYALHRADSNARAEERAAAIERANDARDGYRERQFLEYRASVAREVDALRDDIKELRSLMRKMTGYVPRSSDITIAAQGTAP